MTGHLDHVTSRRTQRLPIACRLRGVQALPRTREPEASSILDGNAGTIVFRQLKRRIGWRLGILIGAILMANCMLRSFLSTETLREELSDETRVGVQRLTNAVKRSTHIDMLRANVSDLGDTIDNIAAQSGIEHVRIYNKAGRIVYSGNPEERDHVVDMDAEACYQCHTEAEPLTHLDMPRRTRIYEADDHRVLAAIEVIYNEPRCYTADCHIHSEKENVLGVLDIGVSLQDADQRVETAQRNSIWLGLIATFLVVVLCSWLIQRIVGRPMKSLRTGIRNVAEGHLGSSIRVHSNDEIGDVARSFNDMTAELDKARAELRRWTETLEQQVEEKTRDLQIAQEQVIRSVKMSSLGVLAAGVAHELNSPLTGILTFAHLLMQKAPPNSSDHEDLEVIVHETQRCAKIIRQLLDFSRENAPERQLVDPNEVVRKALHLVAKQALFHDVELEVDLEDGLPQLELDFGQMEQVFLNLLVNAAEAMPPRGGRIFVTSRTLPGPPQTVEIVVRDTGLGIPDEIRGRIFDPFFSSKTQRQGTGLGLAVSYGIVRKHGGDIHVESIEGEGTTFTITLPVLALEEALS